MKGKINILVIAPFYDIFVKELTDATSRYIKHAHVAIHHNYLSELSKYLPAKGYIRHVRRFIKENILKEKDRPSNVDIYLVSLLYFIPDGMNRRIGGILAKKLEQLIKQKNIDFNLIHAHFTWPTGYAGVMLGKKFGVPIVITVHENREWFLREINSRNPKIYHTWKNSNALVRVNKIDVSLLKNFNNNVYHIPNGYNPEKIYFIDKFKARKILNLPTKNKIIFGLAYLSERKGYQFLIESIYKIIKSQQNILCVIGGEGPYKPRLENKINQLNLQKYVKLVGFIPEDHLNLWFNAADVFVLPSLSEGNPTVMFEALGCGLPFIGTRVGGVPEIIISEDYGLLVEPANSKDLAEKILIALNKEWDREKIRKYAEQFTWGKIAQKTIKIYEELFTRYNIKIGDR